MLLIILSQCRQIWSLGTRRQSLTTRCGLGLMLCIWIIPCGALLYVCVRASPNAADSCGLYVLLCGSFRARLWSRIRCLSGDTWWLFTDASCSCLWGFCFLCLQGCRSAVKWILSPITKWWTTSPCVRGRRSFSGKHSFPSLFLLHASFPHCCVRMLYPKLSIDYCRLLLKLRLCYLVRGDGERRAPSVRVCLIMMLSWKTGGKERKVKDKEEEEGRGRISLWKRVSWGATLLLICSSCWPHTWHF